MDDGDQYGEYVKCGLEADEKHRKEKHEKKMEKVTLFIFFCTILAFAVWWEWPVAIKIINSQLSR